MDIRLTSIDFSLPLSGAGPRTSSQTLVFPRQVKQAVAAISGYVVEFSGNNDHHVGQIEIKLDSAINANTVTVNGTFGLRDWSGNWDDAYDGSIQCVVLADLVDQADLPPRTDMIITGMELNQAVQFFRAGNYLDDGNVQPDNSIWLAARKNTGVRVYVDYQRDRSKPAVAHITGSLVVSTSATTLTLNPINPGGAIQPRPDNAINMAVADHTLNFMIPASQCVGEITVKCLVWDQADATQRPAPVFSRTLSFTAANPLQVYLVGVAYTAVQPNLPAPTQAAVSGSLSQLISTYPTGDIFQTGYTTLSFGETVTGNVANGCGSGFNHLLDRLNDLRGSSPDIYLGSLPAGVVFTPGNSIGGCAPQGGQVSAVFVDVPGDVPHEIGHDFGRKHAPCTGGRCKPPPANVDDHYPQYGSFPSDSIGVFGFDPTTNTVFNPASTFDFMSYSFPQWVSPYTYNGLRGSNFGAVGGPSPGPGSPHLRGGVDIETLFLGLTIDRQRRVLRRPSFHFPAPWRGAGSCGDRFMAEFLDVHREVLYCCPLHEDCSQTGCCCWPKMIRNDVPYPLGARWFLVWEGDRLLYEEEIPQPPLLKISDTGVGDTGVNLSWKPMSREGQDPPDPCVLWYLVHWFDESAEDWRGVAGRQQQTALLIPRRLFGKRPEMQVRVLATSGIATSITPHTIMIGQSQTPRYQVSLLGVQPEGVRPMPVPPVIRAVITDDAGRQLSGDRIHWYNEKGQEIGRGEQLDLRTLGTGKHQVRAVALGLGGAVTARTWTIERSRAGYMLHAEASDPEPPKSPDSLQPHTHPHPKPDEHPHPHE
jgi:hypothetical protein